MNSAAGDWPMWRYDAGRTAASEERLPAPLAAAGEDAAAAAA